MVTEKDNKLHIKLDNFLISFIVYNDIEKDNYIIEIEVKNKDKKEIFFEILKNINIFNILEIAYSFYKRYGYSLDYIKFLNMLSNKNRDIMNFLYNSKVNNVIVKH